MAASTQPNPKIAAAASRSTTSGVEPEAARQAPLPPKPRRRPKSASAGQAPLHRLHAAGIAAGGDDTEVGARLFERCEVNVGLLGRVLDIADLHGAMGER